MRKEWLAIKNTGFSVVEVLLAVSVLALIITGFAGAIIYGEESSGVAGGQARASFVAEEGLEAVRNIRDAGFTNLTDGTYGLSPSGNQWSLTGSSDTTDIFTRVITVSSVDTNRKQIVSTVTWQQTPSRTGSLALTTYLTNWKASGGGGPPTKCNEYCISLGTYVAGTCRKGVPECNANGETVESGGNSLCQQAEGGTCCCKP